MYHFNKNMKTLFNFPTPKPLSILLSATLLITICLSACNKSSNSQAGLSAYVMAVNSAQASAPQDVYVDNAKVSASAIAYTQNTDYIAVSNGTRNVQFRSSTTVNSSFNVSLSPNSYYTFYYTDDNSTVVTQNDRTSPGAGKARVRFINLSSALNSSVDFGLTGGGKIVTGLAYKTASVYNEVDAATSFSLYAAGSSSSSLSIPTTIQAGKIYTIYLSGATTATLTYRVVVEN